ncbi:MAG: energy-coupling factor ABC transporter ATP-binding protein [Thermoplasmata archaeon]|jgi:cobalt/nickel transport system ATP-binding protein|nr:energy-coupling factor ABC transporter ATP-binding protein [Thermoplasmata archaeon]
MKALEIKGLAYAYEDGTVALKDIHLEVDEGEKIAIIGPNGAGKSTLLHLIAGFRMPFEGTVKVMGSLLDESGADKARRSLGLLFQDPDDQLFMPTVAEDVEFGPRNLGLDDPEGRALRALRSVGAEHLAPRRPHRLSHGMKKRVAIAGILAMDPTVLLLDEPTAGLDPRSRRELVELMRAMDRTMLIATHDLDAVAEVVDRAVVLDVSPVMEGGMADLISRREELAKVGLEVPQVTRLFDRIAGMGYPVEDIPVTMDQAAAELTKVVDREAARGRKRP